MPLANLGELRTAALGPRSDMIGQFGDFLALAEQRMYYGGGKEPPLRVLPMEKTTTLTFVAGEATLPAAYLDKRALYMAAGGQTVALSFEPPSVFYPMSSLRTGNTACAYTIEGNTIKLSPAIAGTAKLLHYSKLGPLDGDNSTNDILMRWPGVYLFGTQIELYRTLRNEGEMMTAIKMYLDAVSSANAQTIVARSYGGPVQRRVVGFGV